MCAWNDIINEQSIAEFNELTNNLHDSCIKELRYISGAYVASDLSMHPINDQRLLRVIIQCQSKELPMIELEFEGLQYLKLSPIDTDYTCEISDATLLLNAKNVFWCDKGGLTEMDLEQYTGTIICAKKLKWRPISKACLGNTVIYDSKSLTRRSEGI